MSEELKRKLRDLSALSNLLESYALYHVRRSIGNFYIFISATISIFLFLGFSLSDYLSSIAGPVYGGIAIYLSMLIALVIIFFISANYFRFIEIYKPRELKRKGRSIMWLWIPISIAFMVYMFLGHVFNAPEWSFPFAVEVFVGLGTLVNYFDARGVEYHPGKVEKEYLYSAILLFIGSILILIQPLYGWFIVTVTALMGAYAVGIYITVTAERVFVEAGVYGGALGETSGDA